MVDYIVVEGEVSTIITKGETPVHVLVGEPAKASVIVTKESGPSGPVGVKGDKGDTGDPENMDLQDLTILFDNRLI